MNLLVAFDALASERNVTRAARLVGVTQSAMSHSLSRLRTLFQDELFVRCPGGVRPTPRAEELAETVASVLSTVQSRLLEPEKFDPATAERSFTIGVSDFLEALVLPPLVGRVHQQAPGVRIDVHSTDRLHAQDFLDERRLDLGIGKTGQVGALHRSRTLWTEHQAVLSRPELTGPSGTISAETFWSTPHAVLGPTRADCAPAGENREGDGPARRVVVTTPHLFTLPCLVHSTGVLATVPESLAEQLAAVYGLAVSPTPVPFPAFDISMVWHASLDQDPAHLWLRSLVLEVVAERTRGCAPPDTA